MSNAFIIIKEDTLCYDQIRATEMLAYFDTTGALSRFDAMGDANAIFYLQEDSVYATVNKSEAKMLSAYFKNGDVDRVYYFESAKNDGYPVAQMTSEERVLKGFSWQPELRPSGRQDVTPYSIRPSERSRYAARPRTSFEYTDKFYPGYMPGVMKEIERGRLAKADAKARKRRLRASCLPIRRLCSRRILSPMFRLRIRSMLQFRLSTILPRRQLIHCQCLRILLPSRLPYLMPLH